MAAVWKSFLSVNNSELEYDGEDSEKKMSESEEDDREKIALEELRRNTATSPSASLQMTGAEQPSLYVMPLACDDISTASPASSVGNKKTGSSQKSAKPKQVLWNDNNPSKLIDLCEERCCFWDITHKGYHNRDMSRANQEISDELGIDKNDCQGKWKNPRSQFLEESITKYIKQNQDKELPRLISVLGDILQPFLSSLQVFSQERAPTHRIMTEKMSKKAYIFPYV
eukprot:gene1930-2194_t